MISIIPVVRIDKPCAIGCSPERLAMEGNYHPGSIGFYDDEQLPLFLQGRKIGTFTDNRTGVCHLGEFFPWEPDGSFQASTKKEYLLETRVTGSQRYILRPLEGLEDCFKDGDFHSMSFFYLLKGMQYAETRFGEEEPT